jgi:Zn-dependent protease
MAARPLRLGVPRSAFRPSGIFLGLVAATVAGGALLWTETGNQTVNMILFIVAGWLVSLCLHEYAHALLALRAGDHGVVEKGYLTLNPLKYTHWVLSVLFPVLFLLMGGIGLPGGAVWVDRHSVRDRMSDSLISAAGPAVNVVFTVVLTLPLWFVADPFAHLAFWAGLAFLAFLQLTASVLNLLPVPGLDGGNMVRPWLDHTWQRRFDVVAPFGMLALFILLFQPMVNRIFFRVVFFVSELVGIPTALVAEGLGLLQFWR